MNAWEWFTESASVNQVVNVLGLGALAILFARDLIITKGQHLRRVQDIHDAYEKRIADLLAHHSREIAEKDARLQDSRESRDGYKEATRVERERADKATASLAEVAGALRDNNHILQALNRAIPPSPHHHEGTVR